MALFNTTRAYFYDQRGEKHGKKSFNKKKSFFYYGDGAYNINLNASYDKSNPFPLIWSRRTYRYNIDNSDPFFFGVVPVPQISPNMYAIQLKTETAKKLNNLSKSKLSELLSPRNIAIALGAIVVIWYVSTHKII